MASAELRAIRRRIRSVESTKKITRAMELIAASRIVKARQRVNAARPYAEKMTEVIQNVGRASGAVGHPLLERRTVRTMGVLVISSDRGLAGAYNSSVMRMAEGRMSGLRAEGVAVRLYAIGKKAQSYFSFRAYEIANSFFGVTDQPTYEDARQVGVARPRRTFANRQAAPVDVESDDAFQELMGPNIDRKVVRSPVEQIAEALEGRRGDQQRAGPETRLGQELAHHEATFGHEDAPLAQ